jgi:tRNA(fMet)-specific endonuclease VapC
LIRWQGFSEEVFSDAQRLHVLSYTSLAESLYQQWRQQGIRGSTHDLRIAAICVAHDAKLISRNRRDYERIPGLTVEFLA